MGQRGGTVLNDLITLPWWVSVIGDAASLVTLPRHEAGWSALLKHIGPAGQGEVLQWSRAAWEQR